MANDSVLFDPVLLNDWHPVATVAELEEKRLIGCRLLEQDIVVWHSADGPLAWQDQCVHRGTRLSLGRILDGERIECPYHGWVFNRDGRCVHIPAMPDHAPPERAHIRTYHARERYGWIWVCMGEESSANDIPPFPEWHKAEFRKIFCGPYPVAASGPRIVENFLDVAHFAFVHENILGTRSHSEIEDYDVSIDSHGVEARNVRVYQPDPYGTGQGDTVAYTYRVYRPLTAYLLKESAGPQFSILLVITPHSPTQSSAWMWMALNYGHDIPAQELIDWQDEIFAQDRPIVESQRPQLLPLDPQAELSMRCDRTAVSYRRWLRELGLRFGVMQ